LGAVWQWPSSWQSGIGARHPSRAPVVSSSSGSAISAVIWQGEAPPPPRQASEVDAYLDHVVARAQQYPETVNDALELGLDVIAKQEQELGLEQVVKTQREFARRMTLIANSIKAPPVELPRDFLVLLEQLRNAPDLGTRKDLAATCIRRLVDLPMAAQNEAVEQLKAAVAE